VRVAVVIESPISVGGGFNQALSALLQLGRLAGNRHEVLAFTTVPGDRGHLEALGIDARILKVGRIDPLVRPIILSPYFEKLQDLTGLGGSIERQLLKYGVDLAYFTAHSSLPMYLRQVSYMTTVLDVCHLDQPEFPEVATRWEFFRRESIFFNTLSRAIAVVCASESMRKKLVVHYGVDPARLVAMPFSPSPFLGQDVGVKADSILLKYNLNEGYYFYPAQFWPHKNHVRILQALAIVRTQGVRRVVVFSGKDHGNLRHIMAEAARLGVADCVRTLGFVPPQDIRGIYENCLALVMPTYFGPTNIPPLEAWLLGRPVVYSSHLSEQTGNAALLVNPDSPEELASALLQLEDVAVREALIKNGYERLRLVERERVAGDEVLARCLDAFSRRIECRPKCT
jgi:glycosyltransferase involved in cell wall biosynthesis